MTSSIAGAALDALGAARHADPFSILGPHRDAGTLVIRTFQPSAEQVALVGDGHQAPMARVHASGIFEAEFDGVRPRCSTIACASAIPAGTPPTSTIRIATAASSRNTTSICSAGQAHAHLRQARRASDADRRGRRRALRRLGAQRRARQRRRRLQRVGRTRSIRCGRSARAASGKSSFPASATGERYKFEIR